MKKLAISLFFIVMTCVGFSAHAERITSLRLALALTFCNEPPFSLTLTLVLQAMESAGCLRARLEII